MDVRDEDYCDEDEYCEDDDDYCEGDDHDQEQLPSSTPSSCKVMSWRFH